MAASNRTSDQFESMTNRNLKMLESQWRMWGDPSSLDAVYRMGFDTWKTWADIQLSLLDTCMKMGALSLDPREVQHGELPHPGLESKASARLKKVSNE